MAQATRQPAPPPPSLLSAPGLMCSLLACERVYHTDQNLHIVSGTFNQQSMTVAVVPGGTAWILPAIGCYVRMQGSSPGRVKLSIVNRITRINDTAVDGAVTVAQIDADLRPESVYSADGGSMLGERTIETTPQAEFNPKIENIVMHQLEAWNDKQLVAYHQIRFSLNVPRG